MLVRLGRLTERSRLLKSMIDDLSVCVTSFGRARYLDRALMSVVKSNIRNIVISTSEPDKDVERVLAKPEYRHVVVSRLADDLGCHHSWLDAAYHCPTKRMILLHDDDAITPEFEKAYEGIIKPAMDEGYAQFCSWRAHLLHDNGKIQPTEWFKGPTRQLSSGYLRDILLRKGRLSLSPIISIFDRDTLIYALKEGGHYLYQHEECLYRPGMLLGTEIIAYLRHCANLPKWMYVDQVLSHYGCCESSGTVAAEKSGNLRPLTLGYDRARTYFMSGEFEKARPEPKIIFLYDDVEPLNDNERRRFDYARNTWQFHFGQGDVLEFPTHVRQWWRSSKDMGDPRPVPYLRDVLDYGLKYARQEDVLLYANRDICLTTGAPERIIKAVQENGVAVAWRRNFIPKHGRLYKHSTNAKRDGGVDLVFVSPGWWMEHRDKIPDMFLGRECWDWVFRIIAEEQHGKSIYVDDVAYHEPHSGQFWKQNKKTNPGQAHNRGLAKVFFARRRDRRALMSLQ